MQSILQIFKVNEARRGEKDGRKWEMQDAECALLDDAGTIQTVGVLQLPRDLVDKATPGVYLGSFALKAGYQDRRIGAVLVGLNPVPPGTFGTPKAATPAPAPKVSA
jgi:hypothetical protein